MRSTKIYFIIVILFLGCNKYKNSRDDLKEDLYYRGRAFWFDETGALTVKPLGGKTVNIGYASDSTNNFILSSTTDANGYFLFENLKKNTAYSIFGEYEDAGIKYFAQLDTSFSASVDSSVLVFKVANKRQNGIIYTVTDLLGGPINNCSVCIFANILGNNQCNGTTYSLTTNPFGIASKFNVPAVKLTNYFKVTAGTVTLSATDVIDPMPAEGVIRKKIVVL